MGTLISRFTKSNSGTGSINVEKPQEYSWDKYPKLNAKDYSFSNVISEITGKMPGSVNGQQFTIQNCISSVLYVFDHMNTLTIDDCNYCTFILGPVKESIFIRDCKHCVCVASCGQFRARDCCNMNIFLCCPTQPIIEASIRLRFNCLQFFYKDFSDHMKRAGLSPFNNKWSYVHDFTPGDQENDEAGEEGDHWSILNRESIPVITSGCHDDFNRVGMSFLWEDSIVPYTVPPSGKKIAMEVNRNLDVQLSTCLVVFIPGVEDQQDTAVLFAHKMRTLHPNCSLTSSKEMFMKSNHPFAKNTFGKNFGSGLIIGLHFYGPSCWEACHEVTEHLSSRQPERKQYIFLRKCCSRELCTQDDFFNTPTPYVPAFSG